jgi:tRNA (mo5U34)-methyltransferase
LSNRSSLCRLLGVHNEAERLQQLALRVWDDRGFPTEDEMSQTALSDDRPLWAERVDSEGNPVGYRERVRDLRRQVDSGSSEARQELVNHIRELGPWYHNIVFSGIDTNTTDPDYPARRWRHFEPHVPDDLTGKTVLDIGCDAGYFSLEMKRRHAERVVAIDIMAYRLAQVRFASYWFDLPIEPRELDVYDVERLKTKFDAIVFPGVLYHLKHPLYALEKVANVCAGTLYFQSATRGSEEDFTPADDYPATEIEVFERPEFPKLYFIEKSLNADDSNWWLATTSCLKAMLRVSGFENIKDTTSADHLVCTKKM